MMVIRTKTLSDRRGFEQVTLRSYLEPGLHYIPAVYCMIEVNDQRQFVNILGFLVSVTKLPLGPGQPYACIPAAS